MQQSTKIRIAIIGVGNCASSLVQGIHHYAAHSVAGLMSAEIGPYSVADIEPVVAFDVDARKVGQNLHESIFAQPNCTARFCEVLPKTDVAVRMGCRFDGVAEHMLQYEAEQSFRLADVAEPTMAEVVQCLQEAQVDVLINYLPVGSQHATEFYMECALQAGVGVVNCIPVFIASDAVWQARFKTAGVPIVGDDIKAQCGATILHRRLMQLCRERGVSVKRTYQLNTGGNTDFLNMRDHQRIESKKQSKTDAVQAALAEPLQAQDIHVGPSDYVPWQHDNKVAFMRVEGELFGGVPMNLEVRLSVEDSPNSAAVVVDAVRYCQLARERGTAGPLPAPSAFCCKHPPVQMDESLALRDIATFMAATEAV